ncbi:MAG: hypothetical protein HQM00_06400 [Magnetococcales bacterium]|nr:hypothetical protein [Magnetococcales bacterium]
MEAKGMNDSPVELTARHPTRYPCVLYGGRIAKMKSQSDEKSIIAQANNEMNKKNSGSCSLFIRATS